MVALIRAELLRARSRRLLRWAMLSLAGIAVITSGIAFATSNKGDPQQQAAIQAYQERTEECVRTYEDQLWNPTGPGAGDPGLQACRAHVQQNPPFTGASPVEVSRVDDYFFGFTPPLFAIMLMFGASFFGGDWSSRSITQALTYEPRRLRLLVAKATAIAVTAGVVLFAFLALLLGLIAFVAIFRGSFDGFSIATALATMGRLAGMGSAIAIFGATLASVTRSTGGTFGIAFGYLAVAEPFIVGWKPWIGRWLFTSNGFALVAGEPVVANDGIEMIAISQSALWQSVLVLLGLTLLINTIAATIFRRREIG